MRHQANDYFATLMANMKPGALLLYVDNNNSSFTDWFDSLAVAAGLEVVRYGNGVDQMPLHEDKTDLQPYFSKFSPDPKLTAKIAYRIVRKPIA